ncbi:MAG: GNAT family N-acetyltransferase [Propionicimonas sp.]|nr:GNAT family N-acetyltransferase [Propionicimonas sp.]
MAQLLPLTPESAEVVASWVHSRAEATMAGGPWFPFPLTGADIVAIDADPAWQVFVLADREGRVVASGSLFAKEDGRLQRIGRVLVDPARRGEGWGRAVMELLLARTDADASIDATELGVFTQNTVARELYLRLGFVRSPGGMTLEVDGETRQSEEFTRPRPES